jgi:DNA-binding CsgD family transcriptional regulator
MTKKQLVNRVQEQIKATWIETNTISRPAEDFELESIVDSMTFTFSPGDFYYYVFNFKNMEMQFVHPNVKKVLGYAPSAFTIDTLLASIHPEEIELMHLREKAAMEFLFHKISTPDILNYKVAYVMRMRTDEGEYRKILHQARSISLTQDGFVQQLIGVHTDITHLNIPLDDKISFLGMNGRPSFLSLDPENLLYEQLAADVVFTTQELRVVEAISKGLTVKQIAANMHLSENTIKTHRKKIFRKADVKNIAELVAFSVREGFL